MTEYEHQLTQLTDNELKRRHLTEDGKNAAAPALERRGGLKGGPATARKLSAKKRQEIARKQQAHGGLRRSFLPRNNGFRFRSVALRSW